MCVHVQFVGPSPLPSPSKDSPMGPPLLPTISTALLALTEDPPSSSRAAAAAAQVAATTEVTTHVETAASAGAGAANHTAGEDLGCAHVCNAWVRMQRDGGQPPQVPSSPHPAPPRCTAAAACAAAELASTTGRRRLGPNDFELLRIVGQGAFGKVFQVRKRDTREIFAMKVCGVCGCVRVCAGRRLRIACFPWVAFHSPHPPPHTHTTHTTPHLSHHISLAPAPAPALTRTH